MPDSYLDDLAAHLDWDHPLLAGLPAALRHATPRAQLLAATAALRALGPTHFGFAPDYHARLQAAASEADRAEARRQLDKALGGDLYFPPHHNSICHLGPDVLALAVDAAAAARIAEGVLARQADWPRMIWCFGITCGVMEAFRALAPLPEVPDEALLPLLGWMATIAPAEWASARRWGDRMLGPSGHNWYIHAYFGLWGAAVLVPFLRPVQAGRALAPTQLEREVALLFASDGWSKEGAAGYHHFAARNVCSFTRLAEHHGVRFSPAYYERLRAIANAGWQLQGPDGDGPIFGDDAPRAPAAKAAGEAGDAGSPSATLPQPGFGTLMRQLAARFGLGEALGAADALFPLASAPGWLPHCGDDLAPALAQLTALPPPLDTALPVTGLYALRNRWATDGDWLAFNAKGIGPTVTSHQHADLLNLELCVRGRRVLVDNWYGDISDDDGSYDSAPEIRNDPMKRRWRVGSSAHNVVTVDGQDIVPVVQIYRYGWHETPLTEAHLNEPGYAWLSGVHEAWRRLPNPVMSHRRSIFYLRNRYWVLFDCLTPGDATTAHRYEQHFQLAPGAVLRPDGQVHSTGEGGNILLAPAPGLGGAATLEPCPHPIRRYQNPDHLVYTREAAGDTLFATVLVPFTDTAVPTVRVQAVPVLGEGDESPLAAFHCTGLQIEIDGVAELLVCQHAHWNMPWRCEGHSGSGRLYHSALGELATGIF